MRRFTLFMASLFLTIGVALAQKTVKGVVVSAEDNEGIPGASLRVKGTTVGVSTNIEGKFTLTVPNGAKMLIVSSIGYKTQEVAIKPDLRIVMKPEASTTEELVVLGYGTSKSIANTTASIAKVGSKTIQNKPVPNVMDAIQGKVAGLQILTAGGEPGQLSSVLLHGTGTLSSLSSAPLYILDGVPVSPGTVQSMNPNDFESVQVLKDASATSIYGARAANGVIYITTKKGAVSDRASISVRANYGISSLANTDYYERVMGAEELRKAYKDAGLLFKDDAAIAEHTKRFPSDFKWYKHYYRDKAPTYSADMSVSGGAGRTNYYVSGGLHSSKGLRPRSSYDRFNFRANLNSSLNEYISFGVKNSVTYDITRTTFGNRNSSLGGFGPILLPYYSPYNDKGELYVGEKIPGLNFYDINYLGENYPDRDLSLNISSVANVVIKPFKGMTLSSTVGMDLTDGLTESARKPSYAGARGNGTRTMEMTRTANWTFSNTAEYKMKLREDDNLSFLAGHEYIQYHYKGFSASGQGIADDRLLLLGTATKEKSISEGISEYAFLSFFGRISYDLNKRYFIDLTLRNDNSSRFAANVRSGIFWSAGLLWKAKEEGFLKDLDWLDLANVKFSHGTSGNAGVGYYDYLATVASVSQYNGVAGWGIRTPGNPDLSWEKQTKTTIGVNLGLLKKFNVNLELYRRVTSDMLMDVPQPYTTGYSSLISNVASYQNQGVDLRVDWDILQSKKGANLSAYLSFGYNMDKVLSLFQGRTRWEIPGTGVAYVVGKPLSFYYPIFKQVNPNTGFAEWYKPGEDVDVKTTDPKSFTNIIDPSLNQNTGIRRYAPINGGWGLNFDYKGLSVSADFSFVLGKHMINNDRIFTENALLFANKFNQTPDSFKFWRKKGDIVMLPSLDYVKKVDKENLALNFDTRVIEDASFMRLKNLTIGYQVPKEVLAKQAFFRTAKVYVTARNLLTWTKYSGPDPEPNSNLALGGNPNTKQVSVGLEFGF